MQKIKSVQGFANVWGCLLVWTIVIRRFPLKSSNSLGREVDVHHQASFWKGYVLYVDKLLYFGLESIVVFSWVSNWSNMVSTLHIRIVLVWVWFWQQLERLGLYQWTLNQIWQKLILCHSNWIGRRVPSFQIVTRPMLDLTLTLITSALGSLICMRSNP